MLISALYGSSLSFETYYYCPAEAAIGSGAAAIRPVVALKFMQGGIRSENLPLYQCIGSGNSEQGKPVHRVSISTVKHKGEGLTSLLVASSSR